MHHFKIVLIFQKLKTFKYLSRSGLDKTSREHEVQKRKSSALCSKQVFWNAETTVQINNPNKKIEINNVLSFN